MGLMATGFRAVAGVALVVMGLMAVRVSAQAHHIVGDGNGWGPDLDVSSWLSGRVFSVGDRIWFKYSGTEDSIVELEGFEDFLSCNLTNPIKMYTDPVSHVILDKEGPRYFASRNPERCKNGLKLPVNVRPGLEYDPPFPDDPSEFDPPFSDEPTPHGPYPPFMPTPPHEPPVDDRPPPPPPYEPPVYDRPPPPPPYEPPVHDRPPPPPPYEPPVHDRPPPPPPYEPPVHDRPPPPPPYEPPVHDRPPPPPPYEPPVPVRPPPPPPYAPPVPVRPPPPPPYEPPTPSTAARVSAWSLVLAGGMLMWGA